MVAAESVAGNTRTGMLTRLIFRNPFQVGLAAMCTLSFFSPAGQSRLSAKKGTGYRVPGTGSGYRVQGQVQVPIPGRAIVRSCVVSPSHGLRQRSLYPV